MTDGKTVAELEQRVATAKANIEAIDAERERIWGDPSYRGNYDSILSSEIKAARKALWAAQGALEQAQMSEQERTDLAEDLAIHDHLVRLFERSDSDL